MARYLLLWELDKSKVPLDPKERAMGWAQLINMVKKDMKKGQMFDVNYFFSLTTIIVPALLHMGLRRVPE